jgi:organic radical activating enzyme
MEEKKKFICSLPWNHLSVHPHGHVSPCCEVNWSSPIAFAKNKKDGKYTGENLNIINGVNQVINSDSYKELRLQMLNGEIPSACTTCHNTELIGGTSKRMREKAPEMNYEALTKPDGSIIPDITNLELRLGNYCNLKCRSCNAESSTSWIADYHKLKDKINLPSNFDRVKNSPDTDYSWVENIELYVDILKYSKNIDMLQISGGEPFLVDKHSYLLDLLIENGIAQNISISYITNANYDFDKVKPILDKLKTFKQVSISVSIDDTYKRNTYIRSLSNFELTIHNLKRFLDEYNFNFLVNQTINAFNFLYVEELTQYLEKEGLYTLGSKSNRLFINDNYVITPDYQSPDILPKQVRQAKLNEIQGKLPKYFYDRLKANYYDSPANGKLEEFYNTTKLVDKVRKEKMADIFPKLINLSLI